MGMFLFFDRKRLGPKSCYGNSTKGVILFYFLMHIYGAKFQEHCFNISRDIIYSVFHHFLVANKMTSSLIKFAV